MEGRLRPHEASEKTQISAGFSAIFPIFDNEDNALKSFQ